MIIEKMICTFAMLALISIVSSILFAALFQSDIIFGIGFVIAGISVILICITALAGVWIHD